MLVLEALLDPTMLNVPLNPPGSIRDAPLIEAEIVTNVEAELPPVDGAAGADELDGTDELSGGFAVTVLGGVGGFEASTETSGNVMASS